MVTDKKPKILCLTETHITDEIEDSELFLDNYKLIRTNSQNYRTGGVLTYIQNDIDYKLLYSENIDNNVWINAIQLTGKYDNTIICNAYHSPSESDVKIYHRDD